MTKIGILQMQVLLGEVDVNYRKAQQLMEKAVALEAEILVLPEMWNVGFFPTNKLGELADKNGERAKHFLTTFAKAHRVSIVGGSVAMERENAIYNTTYVVDREGRVVSSYDKVHTFSYGGEDAYICSGDSTHRFLLSEFTCSSSICYDLRFPELFRKETVRGIDLWFLPAEWPTKRLAHWRTLIQARAIENQMFFCAVNGCGSMGTVLNGGHSMLVDPRGEILVELGELEEVRVISIDKEELGKVRSEISVFKDRREEVYKN